MRKALETERLDGKPLRLAFERELAKRNNTSLLWSHVAVSALMLLWWSADFLLAPDHALRFLAYRIAAVVVATLPVVSSLRSLKEPTRAWAFTATWFLIWGTTVAAMLPYVGSATTTYVIGLSLLGLAAGVLPMWPIRWTSGTLLSIAVLGACGLALSPDLSLGTALEAVLTYTSIGLGALVSAVVKYRYSKLDFERRLELEEAGKRLTDALEQLKEVDRLKNEFFANISHELRTPLTLILSPVDELLRTLEAGAPRDALRVVRKNARRLLRMIDDLLDLAKLEAGGLRLRVTQLDVGSLALGVFESFQPAAKANGIKLYFDAAGEPLEAIYGDPHRIEIILTNLVGNAMKFTPRAGSIGIRVEWTSAGVAIRVSDTGPGISEREQERIFVRFHQTEGSARRRQGGVGIGLALARELAELHGGELTVESTPGEGSTFTLLLRAGEEHFRQEVKERRSVRVANHPGRRSEDLMPPDTAKVALGAIPRVDDRMSERVLLDRGRLPRVLVVEDEEDLRGFIAGVLRKAHEVETAKDGAEALELLKKNRPDLVLSDVMMPGTTGLDLCRSIKADPGLRHIPVILLTARGESEAALEGYAAGADDFVSKPFHTKVLLARVRAHLKVRALSLQLADQARLVSAGTLAAGMAHEIKNPLNAMKNAAYVLKRGGSGRVSNETLMNLIVDAIDRIDGVVSALGEHARPADGDDLRACNVQQGIQATLELLGHKLNGIEVHCELDDVGEVCAPARAFNQVLLNLVDNAARSGAKNIWLELQQADGRVTVAVSDDGPGVPADMVSRLFDPFFTTRKEGEGTGLGLHLSRRIAEGCGGALRYEARAGGGARFVMEVPAMGRAA